MSNNYFKFKQFTINQDNCAMKVCTDACLFGAYMADELQEREINNILDIGSGTGLLSLMLAQKNTAPIDTVEIDAAACTQAKENINQSPFSKKINIYNANILQFQPGKKYDIIISNPPFFEGDLQSGDEKKNAAKHGITLSLSALLNTVDNLLEDSGLFAVLLPCQRSDYFENAAAELNFFCTNKIWIKQTPAHDYFRVILIFSKRKSVTMEKTIIIKNEKGNYSAEFISLLKDFYLYL